MHRRPAPYHLLEAFGVELEYMIVDRETLAVRPLADRLLRDAAGRPASEVVRGPVTWSNELVNHVVELKVSRPAASLAGLDAVFHASVRDAGAVLARYGAMLLPTGAHPLMDPATETQLWPHDGHAVYRLYDRIFGCRGHGWANLQSAHLNLAFSGDDEFGRLHAAVRVLLPLLPALCASTPLLEGRLTGFADTRVETYRHNQDRIPSITGRVVPEAVFTEAAYDARIFGPIVRDVRPYDPDGLLEHHFLNSRGAIARFDRGAVEVRLIDLQECPAADLAVLEGVVAVLRLLLAGRWAPLAALQAWHEDDLAALLLDVVRGAEETRLASPAYLRLFGLDAAAARAGDVWAHLLAAARPQLSRRAARALGHVVTRGTLATRIVRALGDAPSAGDVRAVYRRLAACLRHNTLFDGE